MTYVFLQIVDLEPTKKNKVYIQLVVNKNMEHEHEILINALQVGNNGLTQTYEFVLNKGLCTKDCVRIDDIEQNDITLMNDAARDLEGMLFELNHVRVNPKADNSFIIKELTEALENAGVEVYNRPEEESMSVCFRPLGEITANVRFYLNNIGKLVFLSPVLKPKLTLHKNTNLRNFS
ncbi:MAG: hypothetical protein HOI53_06350 [Francisellaceae bacterium]|nr:hypothetical protein [Francisellaceae bacterium]MBT6207630.1 hypothetical protein [Francisellaceae bacterium]MBT6537858.1 hypothetical protein [Francisellaceae bacterium]